MQHLNNECNSFLAESIKPMEKVVCGENIPIHYSKRCPAFDTHAHIGIQLMELAYLVYISYIGVWSTLICQHMSPLKGHVLWCTCGMQ